MCVYIYIIYIFIFPHVLVKLVICQLKMMTDTKLQQAEMTTQVCTCLGILHHASLS